MYKQLKLCDVWIWMQRVLSVSFILMKDNYYEPLPMNMNSKTIQWNLHSIMAMSDSWTTRDRGWLKHHMTRLDPRLRAYNTQVDLLVPNLSFFSLVLIA